MLVGPIVETIWVVGWFKKVKLFKNTRDPFISKPNLIIV